MRSNKNGNLLSVVNVKKAIIAVSLNFKFIKSKLIIILFEKCAALLSASPQHSLSVR